MEIYRDLVENGAGLVPDSAGLVPDSAGLVPDNIEVISENEKRILEFLNKSDKISTIQVMEIAGVKERRAREILRSLLDKNLIVRRGNGRSTHYILNKA